LTTWLKALYEKLLAAPHLPEADVYESLARCTQLPKQWADTPASGSLAKRTQLPEAIG